MTAYRRGRTPGLIDAAAESATPFDPTEFGISWEALYWAEDSAATTPADWAGVSSWPDMSGNSKTLSQATAARQPGYVDATSVLGGRPGIIGPGLLKSGAFTEISQPLSVVLVAQVYQAQFWRNSANWGGIGFDGSNTTRVIAMSNTNASAGAIQGWAGGSFVGATRSFDAAQVRVLANGASSEVEVEGVEATGNIGSNGLPTVSLGAHPAYTLGTALTSYGPWGLAAVFDGDVTAEDGWVEFVASMRAHYRLDETPAVVVCDGDSRTEGKTDTEIHGHTWPARLGTKLTDRVSTVNVGVGSQTVANMNSHASDIDTIYDASRPANVAVMAGGINDCYASESAATIQTRIETWCTGRQSAGFDVLVCTMPPADTVTGSDETTRQTVNAWILANYGSWADGVVDLAGDGRLTDTADTDYYRADGVHYTGLGHDVWAELVAAELASLGVS